MPSLKSLLCILKTLLTLWILFKSGTFKIAISIWEISVSVVFSVYLTQSCLMIPVQTYTVKYLQICCCSGSFLCVCVKINSLICSPDKFWTIIFCLDIFFHNCNDIQPYITKLTLLNMSHQHKLTWAVEFNWRQIWNGQNLIEYQKDFCKPRVLTQKKNTQLHTKRAKLKRPVMTIMSSLTPLMYDRNKRVTSTN